MNHPAIQIAAAAGGLALCWMAALGCERRLAPTETSSAYAHPDAEPEDAHNASSAKAVGTESGALTSEADNPKPAARAVSSSQRVRNITFDTIKFEMDKEERFERQMLTPEIERLNGARVRIRGYILPSFQQSGITKFVLVRDNMECCFGPGAALYDCIVVDMAPGESIEYTVRPVAVEGTFAIEEWIDEFDNTHLAIYHMVADDVN